MGESVAKSHFKGWAQSVQVGATDLIQFLEFHPDLQLNIQCTFSVVTNYIFGLLCQLTNLVLDVLDAKVKSVNSKRQAKGFLPITLAGDQHDKMFSVSMLKVVHYMKHAQ